MTKETEIGWSLEPLPRVEAVDLLALDPDELYRYGRDAQLEIATLRVLLTEALRVLVRANTQSDRSRERVRSLLIELRTLADTCRAQRAEIEALRNAEHAA